MTLWQRFAGFVSELRKLGERQSGAVSNAEQSGNLDQSTLDDFSDSVCDVGYILQKYEVSEYESDSPNYGAAIEELQRFAQLRDNYAQYYLALLLSSDGPHADFESAYVWFSVSFRGRGYAAEFNNQNSGQDPYLGPVGDFRNESEVCYLVDKLGFDRIQELDVKAAEWFKKYGSEAES